MLLPACAARLPRRSSANVLDQKSNALVVGRIQPEHAVENALRLLESAQPPQAQPKSIHATEKWPVVDPPPRKQTIEAFTEGQFTDPKPHLVMANSYLWPVIESNVAKVCMSIETAKIGLAQIHQNSFCAFNIAAILQVVGLYDRGENGSSASAPGNTCSISNSGRDPHAMICLAQSSIGSASSPQ